MMMSGKSLKAPPEQGGMPSGSQLAQFYPGDEAQPDQDEADVQDIQRNLELVTEMALETGFDAQSAIQNQDFKSLIEAAQKSPMAGTDGGIEAIESLSYRLGLPSQYGNDYEAPAGDEADPVYGSQAGDTPWGPAATIRNPGAPVPPEATGRYRSRGGIGHR